MQLYNFARGSKRAAAAALFAPLSHDHDEASAHDHAPMSSAVAAKAFVLAGNARITLSSLATGARYTFRVSAPKDRDTGKRELVQGGKAKRFVSLLTGPSNESDYTYLGMLVDGEFCLTKASKMSDDSVPVKAFRFFAGHVLGREQIPAQLEVRHEGSCGRCGRALTVPESIDSGIGPECRKHVFGG